MMTPITITSPSFAAIVLALIVAGQMQGGRYLSHVLLAAGALIAFSWSDPSQAVFLIVALVSNYAVVRYLWAQPKRATTAVIACSVAWHTLLLCLTKLGAVSAQWGVANVIGLSYMTFRQIHLIIEAPDQDGELPLLSYFAFLLNPLALIAGPIQLWPSHQEGLEQPVKLDETRALSGGHRIATGLLKVMVLAPLMAGQHVPANLVSGQITPVDILVMLYSYYIFLYLDFSGYIDVVRGVAILCGFNTLPENFNKPYLAPNFQQFWTRWNITLGQWFRIYLFNPMFANLLRGRLGEREELCVALVLFITFFLVGLWHGLAWNFVAFGIVQAVGVCGVPLIRAAAIDRHGQKAVVAYEQNRLLLVVRIIVCQHFIAASFLLLDNDLAALLKVIT